MISEQLLSVLGCPACEGRPPLTPVTDESGEYLACRQCDLLYPVRDNIPVMLVDQAIRRPSQNRESKTDAG